MRIDLHTHSTASDGTLTPTELVRAAVDSGLDVMALTDHDSADGWAEAADAARGSGLTLVPGMEISTKLDGAGVHLLAYLPDPTHPGLARQLEQILDGRTERLPAMIAQLRAAGLDVTADEVRDRASEAAALGRPHVADVLVAKGYSTDRDHAFRDWLSWGRPGYVTRYAPSTAMMVELVVEAGGVPVIAHPWGRGSRRVLDVHTVGALVDRGLTGIEVDHQDHDETARTGLRDLARGLDLVITGSSDFHGAGKVDHELGCNTTAGAQLDRLLSQAADNAVSSGRSVPEVVGL
ncbi:MAG: PHP domain-containing protein [Nocardioidaceae bacterium]